MNDTTLANPIKAQDAPRFVDELWQGIMRSGFGAWSKNDIYDYLLYLFNKYDEKHFFDKNSNEKNERLLKITAAKIKASKTNISVKFFDSTEYDGVFEEFLQAFASGRIAIKDGTQGKLKLTIENPVFRKALENRLKDRVQESFDYNLNSEKVEISCEAFITMLEIEADRLKNSDELVKILQESKAISASQNVKDFIDKVVNTPNDYGASFLKGFIPKVCKALYTNRKDKQ